MGALKVALADDHAVVRMGYRRLLELEPDFEVVAEFGDADAAYEALTQRQAGVVDLLILDLSMPGRSGLDLLHRLSIRLPALRVLVFSMHDSSAMVGQCLDAGAAGFVSKSSEPQELIDAVRRVAAGECVAPGTPASAAPPGPYRPPHLSLSAREFDVLHHLLAGHSVEAIAQRLRLSEKTIANYQTQVRQKLGVSNTVELLRYAREHRLTP
jgi:DNA-binding NarL/FixJ family response regulator